MAKRLVVRIEDLESKAPPSWLPEAVVALWDGLPSWAKRVLRGEGDAQDIATFLEAMPTSRREHVISLLLGKLEP